MPKFRPYCPEQLLLLPPSLNDWLPENHLASFISDTVSVLDLSEFFASYKHEDERGYPAYHPSMMVKLLLYAYCVGNPSSRKIEKACWEDVAYRVLSANQHPDHGSIAGFRRRHLKALAKLFLQVLQLAQKAGLVKLGHVALDGTKIKANASKHKAMSYERMCETEKRLEEEIQELLTRAEKVDAAEDALYGSKRGDELPVELARRESRLEKIREAKAALEAEAKQQAQEAAAQKEASRKKKGAAKKGRGKPPKGGSAPARTDGKPEPKAQRNFTDPESRIMLDGATKGFEQCYNVQAAVDGYAQIIVATGVTQQANDKNQLVPMLSRVKMNTGETPQRASADAGYFSETNITHESLEGIELFVPPDRDKHGRKLPAPVGRPRKDATVGELMRRKLRTTKGKAVYKLRKCIVEPVFGQIKEARDFRRFSFRGLEKVTAEWDLVCATHNLLKLFRAGKRLATA